MSRFSQKLAVATASAVLGLAVVGASSAQAASLVRFTFFATQGEFGPVGSGSLRFDNPALPDVGTFSLEELQGEIQYNAGPFDESGIQGEVFVSFEDRVPTGLDFTSFTSVLPDDVLFGEGETWRHLRFEDTPQQFIVGAGRFEFTPVPEPGIALGLGIFTLLGLINRKKLLKFA